MASPLLTGIPSTQPSCGAISTSHPFQPCSSTAANDVGCFVQKTGLYCAPLATTRGFRYTLDPVSYHRLSTVGTGSNSNMTESTFTTPFILQLSTATNDNSTNPSPPLLGVDGQPIIYQGPARLGQPCVGIPLPATTDPLFQTLVLVATQRLNDTIGFLPGIGAGPDIFSLRGDCEQGSYCDLTSPGGGVGTCKEQLPIFHNCTSYMQCISLRCDELTIEPGAFTNWRRKRDMNSLMEFTLPAALYRSRHQVIETRARQGATVCLPSKLARGRGNGGDGSGIDPEGGLGNEGSGSSDGSNSGSGSVQTRPRFAPWMGAVIAMVVILGAAVIFGLARRRKMLRDEEERKTKKAVRSTTERDRDRERSAASSSINPDEKAEYRYQMHSQDSHYQQERSHLGILTALFKSQRKNSKDGAINAHERIPSRQSADAQSTLNASYITVDDGGQESLDTEGRSIHETSEHHAQQIPSPFPQNPSSSTAEAQPSMDTGASESITGYGRGSASRLSVLIPKITTTLSEPPATSPSTPRTSPPALLLTGQGKFDEGEHLSTVQSRVSAGGSLSPSTCSEYVIPYTSSSVNSSSSSPSETSSAFSRRGSSHAFLSTPPSTSPHAPSSPISPISPISPRPLLSSSPSSRLSHRQSTQLQSRK